MFLLTHNVVKRRFHMRCALRCERSLATQRAAHVETSLYYTPYGARSHPGDELTVKVFLAVPEKAGQSLVEPGFAD